MIHRFVDAPSGTVIPATVFQLSNNVSGTTLWDDIWAVPATSGAAIQITDHSSQNGTYDDVPIESPARTHIAYLRTTDAGPDNSYLRVIAVDGTGDLELVASSISDHRWIDSDWIMYRNGTGVSVGSLKKINRDGTGDQTIVTKTISRAAVSPDGTQIAYIVYGTPSELWVINSDGTGDTQLLSNIGNNIGSPPSWRLDGSAIMYQNNSSMETIAPDGTGQTVVAATLPEGFWDQSGMYDDRFFFTDTTTNTNWKVAQIVFGSGVSFVSPTLSVSRSIHRGVAVVDRGRVFTVQDGNLMAGGVDSMVSILPDGSDLRRHFDPDESSSPLFQSIGFR